MPGPNSPYTQLSGNQVLQQAFDETQDRLRTDATFSGSIDAELDVEIDAADGDNIALANADGSLKVGVTTVGSDNGLNVNVIGGNITLTDGPNVNTYDEVSAVASSVLTTIVTYTPIADVKLKRVCVSGTNIATYDVLIDGDLVDKKRTYFGNSLNADFAFDDGLTVLMGEQVLVRVIHERPDLGDFNARIQVEEL